MSVAPSPAARALCAVGRSDARRGAFDTISPSLPVLGTTTRGRDRDGRTFAERKATMGNGHDNGRAAGTTGPTGFDQPRPYLIIPPSGERGTYAAGEQIRFGAHACRTRTGLVSVDCCHDGQARGTRDRRRTTETCVGAIFAGMADGSHVDIDPPTRGIGSHVPEVTGLEIVAKARRPRGKQSLGSSRRQTSSTNGSGWTGSMGPRYSNDSCAVSAHSPKAIAPFRMERLSPITEPLRQWPSRWSYATRMCVCASGNA